MKNFPIKLGMQSPMTRFVVISVCAHAALFLSSTYAFRFAGHPQTVLSVTFNAPDRLATSDANSVSTVKSNQRFRSENHRGTGAQRLTAAKSETAIPAYTAENAASSADQHASSTAAESSQEAARARIKAQLLADLRRYFEYPLVARRAGWQGTVWLSVTLESNGRVERINITRSSGHDVLDNSAVNAMQRVGRLSEAQPWLSSWSGGRSVEIPVPVVYRLTDG